MVEMNNKKISDQRVGNDNDSIMYLERLSWKEIDNLDKDHCVFFHFYLPGIHYFWKRW